MGNSWFIDFLRDDEYDEDGILVNQAPRVYEKVSKLETVKTMAESFLKNHNTDRPNYRMNLVFFNDALEHLIRISRIIGCPRGNALLVGVGGSGKRSLTKLAAYIARQKVFELQINKMYNFSSLMDDVASLFRQAAASRLVVSRGSSQSHTLNLKTF